MKLVKWGVSYCLVIKSRTARRLKPVYRLPLKLHWQVPSCSEKTVLGFSQLYTLISARQGSMSAVPRATGLSRLMAQHGKIFNLIQACGDLWAVVRESWNVVSDGARERLAGLSGLEMCGCKRLVRSGWRGDV